MTNEVLHRGEIVYKKGNDGWKRCWVKMYADKMVDHGQEMLIATNQVVKVERNVKNDMIQGPWQFCIVLKDQTKVVVGVATEEKREEWIRCLVDAKRAYLAENGKLLFQRAHSQNLSPFVRFAESDSEDSQDENTLEEESQHHALLTKATVNLPKAFTREKPRVLTIIHLYLDTKNHERIVAPIALDHDVLEKTIVGELKEEGLGKLAHKIHSMLSPEEIAADLVLIDINDPASFSLVLPDAMRDVWLRNEEKSLQYYLNMKLEKVSDTVKVAMVPIQNMPPPPLRVQIIGNNNKVSDLSQKLYTVYIIQVEYNDMKWTVSHRYKDFAKLDDDLKLSAEHYSAYIPPLPKKTAITPKKGTFVAKRQLHLQAYLEEVVALPGLDQSIHLMTFLGGNIKITSKTHDILVLSTARNAEVDRSVLHVSAVHSCLRFGDIIMFKTRFGASKVQRKITGSRYDHAAIVVPGSTPPLLSILEATGEGIQVYPLKLRLQAYSREVSNAIVARRIEAPRNSTSLAKMQEFVLGVEGNAYSIFGILNRSKVEKEEKTSNYFCSELVAAALMHLGWLNKDVPPSYYWPGNFEDGGELEAHLARGITICREIALDCKFLEVGKAE
ncbi:ribonuclease H2 subunit A [Thraustotheca clavata]|uniref:Ribonuclease H2 subunit A n=1 Tax=Thraustotheca clavata TaxID=74557 RepID=A0A1W0A5M0_9STRA|nr:ribonuclease H2 subunit A [Thraustotheca clavata]